MINAITTKAKNIRLFNASDARRIYSRLFNEMYHDEIPLEKGKALCYCLNSYLRALEVSEIEKRLEQIEMKISVTN